MSRSINITIVYAFSFFLGFGKFDPFGTNGLYFDIITVLAILSIGLTTDVLKKIKVFKYQLVILLSIIFYLFFAGVIYGIPFLNFKLLAAIIIFWFFSYYFRKNPKQAILSLLLFAASGALISVLYQLGYLSSYYEIRGGRLLIFDENPNSVGTRMALAFIILAYYIIENPLNSSKWRFLLVLFLPGVFLFVIETASRGSFLMIILGVALLLLYSKIKIIYKIIFLILAGISSTWLLAFLSETSLINRFITSYNLIGIRSEIWSNALQIFYDNPFGVGEKGYLNEMNKRYAMHYDTHNLFLQILVTGGILSFILFMAFIFTLIKKSYKELKEKNILFAVLTIVMIFLAGKTGGVITYLVMWYFFAIINGFDIKNYKKNEFYSHSRVVSA